MARNRVFSTTPCGLSLLFYLVGECKVAPAPQGIDCLCWERKEADDDVLF